MKRNLMTILILALLVVNLAMTGIIMFSTVSANKKTVALVESIAGVLELELPAAEGEEAEGETAVSIADTEVYNIADSMTIALKHGDDDKDHYALVEVSFSLNIKDEDYKTYQPMLATNESKIKSEIIDVIGSYTKDEALNDIDGMEAAILSRIQSMFDSKFIFEAYFRDIKFQ